MKKNLVELIVILDRSGSMISIQKDMIGGYNNFIKEQKKLPTDLKVSFYQFDTGNPTVETIYEQLDITKVPELTTETFIPRGGTPLLDAVATVINKVGKRLSDTPENERPEKVLLLVITDGEENSSIEFNGEKVKEMIQHQESVYKWEFVYLGANQDAWAVGSMMGFKNSSTLSYVANAVGTNSMWDSVSRKTMNYRCCSAPGTSIGFDEKDKEKQEKAGYKK